MMHIWLTCKNHRTLRWHCKSIAVNRDGSYNGFRNIFYEGDGDGHYPPECPCPATALTFASPDDKAHWESDQ